MEASDVLDEASDGGKKGRLNTLVAISVALLATFMGICKVKDDNIVQAMQQSQADRVDHWAWYQARKIREDFARSEIDLMPAAGPKVEAAKKRLAHETEEAAKVKTQAEGDQKTYDALNYRDDQFDLSDSGLAIAIALFALTALTQKRWLYGIALVPAVFGIVMGLAGLLGWHLHPDVLANWLGA